MVQGFEELGKKKRKHLLKYIKIHIYLYVSVINASRLRHSEFVFSLILLFSFSIFRFKTTALPSLKK